MLIIDTYLSTIMPPERYELERIRAIIVKIFPDVEEVISYGMPGFKYRGKYLAGFNAFKGHLSFFPTAHPIEVHKSKLDGYKLSKGTIQFGLNNPLPEKLIVALIKTRVTDIEATSKPSY